MWWWPLQVACVAGWLAGLSGAAGSQRAGLGAYTNEWAVHVPGGEAIARAVADELGYDFLGQVSVRSALPGHCLFYSTTFTYFDGCTTPLLLQEVP